MRTALLDAADAEVMVAFWVSLAFPFVTRFFWPWNESWWGWNIVMLDLSIAGALFPDWLYLTFHISDVWLQWLQVFFLGLVTVNVVWRTVMIWRTQRNGVTRGKDPA